MEFDSPLNAARWVLRRWKILCNTLMVSPISLLFAASCEDVSVLSVLVRDCSLSCRIIEFLPLLLLLLLCHRSFVLWKVRSLRIAISGPITAASVTTTTVMLLSSRTDSPSRPESHSKMGATTQLRILVHVNMINQGTQHFQDWSI